jgi:hypothetical protein
MKLFGMAAALKERLSRPAPGHHQGRSARPAGRRRMGLSGEPQAHRTTEARQVQTTRSGHRIYRLRHSAWTAQDADPGVGAKPLDQRPPVGSHRRTLRVRKKPQYQRRPTLLTLFVQARAQGTYHRLLKRIASRGELRFPPWEEGPFDAHLVLCQTDSVPNVDASARNC